MTCFASWMIVRAGANVTLLAELEERRHTALAGQATRSVHRCVTFGRGKKRVALLTNVHDETVCQIKALY